MSKHLADGLDGHALFQGDERSEGVSSGVRSEGQRDTGPQSEGFQMRLIGYVMDVRKQRIPRFIMQFVHQLKGLGQQLYTAEDTRLLPVELQPKGAFVVADKMPRFSAIRSQ